MTPIVGQVLHFYPHPESNPLASTVAKVLANGRVNIGYLLENGTSGAQSDVYIVPKGGAVPPGPYCKEIGYMAWREEPVGEFGNPNEGGTPPT